MKLKLFAFGTLCLALLLCVTSCGEVKNPSEGTETAETTESKPLTPVETAKASFLFLMNEGFSGDPNELLSLFFEDFTVENAHFSSEDDAYPERYYRKGSVVKGEYADGTVQYTVLSGQNLATVIPIDDGYAVTGYQMNTQMTDMSVFSTFGMPMDGSEVTDAVENTFAVSITEDTILVNDDGTVCTVTDEVLDEIAKVIYESFSERKADSASIRESLQYNLEYRVSENTLLLTVSGEIEEIGTFTMELEASSDEENGPHIRTIVDMDTVVDGLSTTVHAERAYTDIRYNAAGNLTHFVKTETWNMAGSGAQNGKSVQTKGSESTVITVDVTDRNAPSITVDSAVKSETYMQSSDAVIIDLKREFSAVLGENGKLAMETSSEGQVILAVEADLHMGTPAENFSEVERIVKDFFASITQEGIL